MYKKTKKYIVYTILDQNKRSGIFILGKSDGIPLPLQVGDELQKKKVARCHEKIRNQRRDHLHKLSRKIADSYDAVAVKDIDMKAMGQCLHFKIRDLSGGSMSPRSGRLQPIYILKEPSRMVYNMIWQVRSS